MESVELEADNSKTFIEVKPMRIGGSTRLYVLSCYAPTFAAKPREEGRVL